MILYIISSNDIIVIEPNEIVLKNIHIFEIYSFPFFTKIVNFTLEF